jgi:hypothetical protein
MTTKMSCPGRNIRGAKYAGEKCPKGHYVQRQDARGLIDQGQNVPGPADRGKDDYKRDNHKGELSRAKCPGANCPGVSYTDPLCNDNENNSHTPILYLIHSIV